MRDRTIMHIDMNAFYASVAQHLDPRLRGRAIAVAGDPKRRSGIILAKSREAKAAGVKTAEAIWQAKQKCPDLIVVPPDYAAYKRYSKLARLIYYEYTDQVEPFGLDESWIDVAGSLDIFGKDPMLIAREISERIKDELGLTVSVGMSWNKVFAKLGSDTDPGDGIIAVGVRRAVDLLGYSRQRTLKVPTCLTSDIANAAMDLIRDNQPLDKDHGIRAIHVRTSNLVAMEEPLQADLFGDAEAILKQERLDFAIDELRRRFGNKCVHRAVELTDEVMGALDIKLDNTVHPIGFLR